MKNFQVRLRDELHTAVTQAAHGRGVALADVIRESLESHLYMMAHLRAGGRIFYENQSGEKVEIIMPGISPLKSW